MLLDIVAVLVLAAGLGILVWTGYHDEDFRDLLLVIVWLVGIVAFAGAFVWAANRLFY